MCYQWRKPAWYACNVTWAVYQYLTWGYFTPTAAVMHHSIYMYYQSFNASSYRPPYQWKTYSFVPEVLLVVHACTRFLSLIEPLTSDTFLCFLSSKVPGWECHFYSLISDHLHSSSYLTISDGGSYIVSQKSTTLAPILTYQWFKLLESGL